MWHALRSHWPEFLMEAAGLGTFMISAGLFGTLLGHPHSPAIAFIPDEASRNVLMGIAMGMTAIAIIYSPWGKRSGAHINPATTITFLRLGKVAPWDAAGYIVSQFLGGAAGVLVVAAIVGRPFIDPPVSAVVTVPGPQGIAVAFVAEMIMTFVLMSIVLIAISAPKLAQWTGLIVGVLVATYIVVEAPLSGMSMNPARTTASALASGQWSAVWIYFVAPPLGMLAAAELSLAWRGAKRGHCAKFCHDDAYRCIFCDYQASAVADSRRPNDAFESARLTGHALPAADAMEKSRA